MSLEGLQLRSLVKKSGELELSLANVAVPDPAPDEIVVRIEATPINPSDLGLLVGPADVSTLKASGTKDMPVVTATVPEQALRMVAARLDQALPVGNEGAGTCCRCRLFARSPGPERQARRHPRRRNVRDLPHREGQGRPAASCRRDAGRRRLLLREPADRARDGQDDADGRPHRPRPHRRRVQPRPDAQQDLPQGRRRPREHRPQRRADENPEGHRREAHRQLRPSPPSWKTSSPP